MPCAPFRILAPQATAYSAHSIDTHMPTSLISLPLLGALWEKMVLSLSSQGSGAHLLLINFTLNPWKPLLLTTAYQWWPELVQSQHR